MLSILRKLINRPVDQQKFADTVLNALQRAWPTSTFTLDREKFQIQQSGGGLIYLQNFFLDYSRAEPKLRREQLDRFVQGVVTPNTQDVGYEDVKEQLLPVLRNLSGMDLVRIEGGDDKPLTFVMEFRPLSDELGMALAIDSELSITQIGSDAMTRWGKSFEELLGVAIDNLRHKAAPSFHQVSPGLFSSHYGDYYDAPRMLVQELIWQLPIGSNPVVMVPNRVCLLVCSADDPVALGDLVEQARSILLEESRPLSDEMFKLTDGSWTAWHPAGEPGKKLRRLQREFLVSGYAEQKQALEGLHEKSGIDVFVASQVLVERKEDGQLISYAVLTNGVHTWLPKADLVFLLEEVDAEPLVVSMSDFLECVGATAKLLPYVLPRYEVIDFPNEDCMSWLKERATSLAMVSA